ncbi:MAG: energy transducer TonB, partial [Acidobacteriota bacterium]|nr:energy transducer TonB [Acidobacteriota bacterium]
MRSLRFNVSISALVLALFGLGISASGQSAPEWETLKPVGEEFTVLIPKGSTLESGSEPYHKMEINRRVYLSQTPNGPVFAVVSLSGIKSNPALYSEMQRVNSYVDAFKQVLAPRIRKATPARLTLVGEKKLQGNAGREYRMTIGDLAGSVHAFATRKRFYAVVYLNTKKDEDVQNQFLSSFVLPERLPEPPPTVAAQAATTAPTGEPTTAPQAPPQSSPEAANAEAAANQPAEPKVEENESAGAQPRKRRPISGGVLNGKAITLPKPEYPAEAREAKAGGNVVVQITIDESGMVSDAKAVSGHPLLLQASINAALQARFTPTLFMGEPVKVTGVIVYN